jgi:hypothetical protein
MGIRVRRLARLVGVGGDDVEVWTTATRRRSNRFLGWPNIAGTAALPAADMSQGVLDRGPLRLEATSPLTPPRLATLRALGAWNRVCGLSGIDISSSVCSRHPM